MCIKYRRLLVQRSVIIINNIIGNGWILNFRDNNGYIYTPINKKMLSPHRVSKWNSAFDLYLLFNKLPYTIIRKSIILKVEKNNEFFTSLT